MYHNYKVHAISVSLWVYSKKTSIQTSDETISTEKTKAGLPSGRGLSLEVGLQEVALLGDPAHGSEVEEEVVEVVHHGLPPKEPLKKEKQKIFKTCVSVVYNNSHFIEILHVTSQNSLQLSLSFDKDCSFIKYKISGYVRWLTSWKSGKLA